MTPNDFAHLPTSARTSALRTMESTRVNLAIEVSSKDRAEARAVMHRLNLDIDRARTAVAKLDARSVLYPPSPDAAEERTQLTEDLKRCTPEHRYASAWSAAADVAHESAKLERAWLDRPDVSNDQRVRMLASPLESCSQRDVTAPGYTVTVLHSDPHSPTLLWREMHHGVVTRSRVRSMLSKWFEREQTHVLRDPHGRLYVAAPGLRMELIPTDIAPPQTGGDVLRAALAAYGFTSYQDSEGGHTWLVVPLDPRITEDSDSEIGIHIRINSDDRVDRPASQHERWSAGVHDQDGDYVTTLTPAPDDSTIAEDSAHVARAVDNFARTVGQR
ncbi:hypothetical protein [Streptomyces sp. NPDC088707]|uniref:hypothetical protein n=1 Tax=Streptomyces sp. NPDC088707 TaxID=3365871 RepID=UPI0038165E26